MFLDWPLCHRGGGLLLLVLLPSAAGAQGAASSFDNLQGALRAGDMVTVTEDDGHRTKGRVADFSDSSLGLLVGRDPQKRVFTVDRTIKIVRNDSVENGILIGLGIGVGMAIGANKSCDTNRSECYGQAYFGLSSVVAGPLIGWAIDASIRKALYIAPGGSATSHLRLGPLLSADRRGMVIAMTF